MKKSMLLIVIVMLGVVGIATAQTFTDYVASFRGDTAVIKDYSDKGNAPSTLRDALNSDTINVPAGRVYMLKANGYYPLLANPTTSSKRTIKIVGSDFTRLVQNKNALSAPPLICGFTQGSTANTGGINWGGDLEVRNCNIIQASADRSLGWAFFGSGTNGARFLMDNCLSELTRWVIIQSNANSGTRLFINDCYFVNLSGQACRRNGGVYDNVNNNTDTIWVENSTHVVAQGSMYKFRNYQIKKAFFNHNTFVDCAGSIFESLGYLSDLTVTNNIFVNSNIQSFCDSLGVWDAGETDADMQPTGLINVDTLPASYTQMARKVLVDRNLAYWDAKLNNIDSILIAKNVNKTSKWVSQRIKMNARTTAMFADKVHFPLLTQGTWYNKVPAFVKPSDLLTAELDTVKKFAIGTVDNASTDILNLWRKVNVGSSLYIYSDWPIPVDLSFTDADLMAGGTGGFPIGDLNWFPAKKTQWAAQANAEHTVLQNQLNTGVLTAVENTGNVPTEFALQQNYPNPFNPSTVISFTLPHAANTTLKVVDMLGREVATLVNGFTTAGSHEIQYNASNLASGVYFYKLTSGDFSQVKKMMLVK